VHSAMTRFFVMAVVLPFVAGCLTALAQSNPAAPAATVTPQLDHFDVTQVDRGLDPCVDFYQYACKKWIAKNPIPPDQANWWLGAKLMLWNQTVVRDILEKASADDPKRNPSEQKIGDHYASCMNEAQINAKGITAIQPELDRIAALQSKTQLPEELARIHRITFTLAPGTDSGSTTALFGFSSSQDLDDASKVVAVLDQGSGWIYPSAKILHSLRRVLVLECDAPIPPHAGAVQPSFDAAGARKWSGIQYAGVSESLRLQEGAAHGARECLSRLVGVEQVLTLRSRRLGDRPADLASAVLHETTNNGSIYADEPHAATTWARISGGQLEALRAPTVSVFEEAE
jgi:Peptidase family M13